MAEEKAKELRVGDRVILSKEGRIFNKMNNFGIEPDEIGIIYNDTLRKKREVVGVKWKVGKLYHSVTYLEKVPEEETKKRCEIMKTEKPKSEFAVGDRVIILEAAHNSHKGRLGTIKGFGKQYFDSARVILDGIKTIYSFPICWLAKIPEEAETKKSLAFLNRIPKTVSEEVEKELTKLEAEKSDEYVKGWNDAIDKISTLIHPTMSKKAQKIKNLKMVVKWQK